MPIDAQSPLLGTSGVVGASPKRFHGTALFDWMHDRDKRSRPLSVSSKDAVLVGRPYCYGLAVGGADAVQRVVEILRTELEMAMQLMGLRSLNEIDSSALWSSKPKR